MPPGTSIRDLKLIPKKYKALSRHSPKTLRVNLLLKYQPYAPLLLLFGLETERLLKYNVTEKYS